MNLARNFLMTSLLIVTLYLILSKGDAFGNILNVGTSSLAKIFQVLQGKTVF